MGKDIKLIDKQTLSPLDLESLHIEVSIHGFLAETSITLKYTNKTSQVEFLCS